MQVEEQGVAEASLSLNRDLNRYNHILRDEDPKYGGAPNREGRGGARRRDRIQVPPVC